MSSDLASRQFHQWLAVADLAHRHIIHAKTSSAVLPHEIERWRRIQRNALIEAGKLLVAQLSQQDATLQAAE